MQNREPFGADPLLERLACFKRLQLALPDFSNQDQSAVGAAQGFFLSQLERPLADLRRVVLNPDDIGAVRSVNILNAYLAAQYGFANFLGRAAELSGARLVPVPIGFAFFAFRNMGQIELEARVAVVVNRHAPSQVIAVAFSETEDVRQAMLRDVKPSTRKT